MRRQNQLQTASCYDHSTTTLKEPLLLLLENKEQEEPKDEDGSSCLQTLDVRCFLFGFLVGLADQVICLASAVAIYRKWGSEPHPSDTSEWILYTLLLVLSHVDILMFPIFTLAIILKLSEGGTKLVQQMLGNQRHLAYSIGLESLFFEGVLLGFFLVYLVVPFFTEVPLSAAAALAGKAAVGLSLYYFGVRDLLVIWQHGEDNNEEDNIEEIARTNDLELALEE
jgi:hypothetical protein